MAITRTPGTGGVIDLWKNNDGTPSKLATGRWADGQGKPQGVGKRWRGWYVGDDRKSHTRRFRTEAEAEAWSNAERGKVVTNQWISPDVGRSTFSTAAEEWLKTKGHRKPKTLAGYRSILDTIVLPKWGDSEMKAISYGELSSWFASLSVSGSQACTGLSASRIIQTHQLMGAVYKHAVRAGLASRNVIADIDRRHDLPTEHAREIKYLTHAQLQGLAERTERFAVLTLILGYCGIRFGEAAALRRGSVKDAKLTIRESATRVTGQGMVTTRTKTGHIRDVAVPPPVWERLIAELPADQEDLVFPGNNGGTLTLGQYRGPFDRAVKAMQDQADEQRQHELEAGALDEHGQPLTPKFPAISPHALRHTAASLFISTGANIKVVQRQLGHATASMTLDRYGHLYHDDLSAAAKALGDAMAAAKQTAA
ncbi:tyrosine-type recombinase/integrase [Mycobacterium sp. 050128]|uniref:tyrosine-type recombinase/integrase n=1 Tax=Mycobacterium sp. 050128 TaxID=3096112 RepID=UPI002ED88CB8